MKLNLLRLRAKIEALPKGRELFIESALAPARARLTTDDLKALVSELETAKRALERIADHLSDVYVMPQEDPEEDRVYRSAYEALNMASTIAQAALKSE